MDTRPIFQERQPWRLNRFLLVFLPLQSVVLTVVLVWVGVSSGPRQAWLLGASGFLLAVVFPIAFLAWGLRTEVLPDRLRVRFDGMPGWNIPLERVENAEVVRVNPLRDFGGWGYRASRKFGWVYNVWGEHAVLITLTDGRKRTVGTQRPNELAAAVLAGALGEPERAGDFHSVAGASNAKLRSRIGY
jgi:hypothetical protein